jgi:hypothetical protein
MATFLETTENENEHAKTFLKFLSAAHPMVQIQIEILMSAIGSTLGI